MYLELRREILIQFERYQYEIYYLLTVYDNNYNFLILNTYVPTYLLTTYVYSSQ